MYMHLLILRSVIVLILNSQYFAHFCQYRLELQVSSLEKEAESRQKALLKTEGQLSELRAKYEATPKQEVLERLKVDVKQLTEELQQAKSAVTV